MDTGKTVLFVGTPCQIGGLNAFLSKDYHNLITIDLICHGVPSPKVWEKYVEYRETMNASKTQRIIFRNKRHGWKMFSLQFKFLNGSEYIQILTKDLYMRGFLSHLYLRPSCGMCSFKQIGRQSDITLADFWGIEKTDSAFNDNKGVSLVMLHSKKGEQLFSDIKESIDFAAQDFEAALKDNPSYYKSAIHSILRERFFNDFNRKPIDKSIEKYCGDGIVSKIRRKTAKLFIIRK